MNHKQANGMKMWKEHGNTTALLFFLKRHEIPHQERRTQVKTIVIEHFNGILFHKYGPANKQNNNDSSNTSINIFTREKSIQLAMIFDWKLDDLARIGKYGTLVMLI